MYVLGISCYYHDGSATLVKDGKLVAAALEERFTRKKHDFSFPINAINYCLKEAGIKSDELDYVGFYEKPLLKFERLMAQHFEHFPSSFPGFLKAMPSWLVEKLRVPGQIRKKLKYKGEIIFLEHHLSHAASSYLVSPFDQAAILTSDGVGEWASCTFGKGIGNKIETYKEIHFPHSLGLLYSAMTAYLGFKVNNDEYKVMGLAAYGDPDKYYDNVRKMIKLHDDGSYELDMSYFVYTKKLSMPSQKMIDELGPMRVKESKTDQKHMDIAAATQKVMEEVYFFQLNKLYEETKSDNLCIAGGVALNSLANGKITKNTPFKKVYIQPEAGDGGTSLGVAFYIYNSILDKKREFVMDTTYYGPGYSSEQIKKFLDENKIEYKELKDDQDIVETTARLIYDNHVIGWFQGRMEWGPRALGNRSILSNATNPEMKDIINAKVKHREMFRPFAPVIIQEDVHDYFDIDKDDEPFMLFVYPIKKEKRKLIPAVTHVDGTGRLQTITKEQNARYYGVIKYFKKLSKIPILINTSFNIRGEPIVCTPQDAYRCMMGTGIDYLVMDKFLVARSDNPKDMWDSEKTINE